MSKKSKKSTAQQADGLSRRERAALEARQPRRWGWPLALGGVGVLCAAIVGGAVWASGLPEAWREAVVRFEYQAAEHTEGPVDYEQSPPVGGPHNPRWLNCGFYSAPVEEPLAVHSLEHGAVWVTYRPGVSAEVLEGLRDRTASNRYLLVSPREDQQADLVVSAWNHQLVVSPGDWGALDSFVREFSAGPLSPEPGAACWGGEGVPS